MTEDAGRSGMPSWTAIIAATGTVFVFAATMIGLYVAPISGKVGDIDVREGDDRKELETIRAVTAQHERDQQQFEELSRRVDAIEQAKLSKDAFGEAERRTDDRFNLEHEYALRELTRIETQVNSVDASLIKRPEIEALLDSIRARVEAISRSLQDARSAKP